MSEEDNFKLLTEGNATLCFDHSIALNWYTNTSKTAIIIPMAQHLSILIFIIYILVTKHWLALLLIPFLFLSFMFFAPSFKKMSGCIPVVIIHLIIFCMLFWSYTVSNSVIFLFAFCLLFLSASNKFIYFLADKKLRKDIIKEQDLFDKFWDKNWIGLIFHSNHQELVFKDKIIKL